MNRKDKIFLLTSTTISGLALFGGLLYRHHWLAAILLVVGWAMLTYAVITNRPRRNWPHSS